MFKYMRSTEIRSLKGNPPKRERDSEELEIRNIFLNFTFNFNLINFTFSCKIVCY